MNVDFNTLRAYCDSQKYSNSVDFRSDFQGFDSFNEMQAAFKSFEFAGDVNPANQTNFDTAPDVCGYAPNVPAYLNSEPLTMFNFDHTITNNLIELNIYIALDYKIEAAEIAKQGQILSNFLALNTTAKDRFKITFISNLTGSSYDYNKNIKEKHILKNRLEREITVCDFSDYITPELLTIICSPAFYRFYILGATDYFNNFTVKHCNGYPVTYSYLDNKEDYINFMDMANELKKIKFN